MTSILTIPYECLYHNVLNIVIPLSLASQVHRHTQIFRSISLFAIVEPIFTQQAETHIPDLRT